MPIADLSLIWPLARPFIALPLARDPIRRYLPADVLRGLLGATLRLWISWDDDAREIEAAGITEIINYPRVKELRLWLVGGRNMKKWGRPMADLLEQYARDMGCVVMTGGDRRGWIRIAGAGWVQRGYCFEKPL